ncbi:MAG: nicotinate-nucleotide adenylyltransferase [Armatimonadetes bacterium]|nr:nicotinate-nucleotide adenylyltransferase [Armatimonadota bacterium]
MDLALDNGAKWSKVGLMGGTFDPIHLGHLVVAEEARERFGLDRVVFVPNGQPPHKEGRRITAAEHRYNMCLLATAENPFFTVSRTEIDRDGPCYTIDTLRLFRAQLGPEAEIYFITGADAVLDLPNWREPDAILSECHVVAAHRPGFDLACLVPALGEERARKVQEMALPALDISSTRIRARVAEGRSVRYLVPPAVEGYIAKMGLYRAAE